MNNLSKLSVVLCVALFVAIGAGTALGAATFPEKPIVLIVPYGASNPAEFFAVTTELFFERPDALAAERPALYEQLRRCYRVDPAAWS